MNILESRFFLLSSLLSLGPGCSTEPLVEQKTFDGFEYEHVACYSYIRGEGGVKQNVKRGISWCNQGHAAGDLKSTALLGHIYFYGLGLERDIGLARDYFESAAQQGDIDSSYMVFASTLLIVEAAPELTTREDLSASLEYLQLAVDGGHADAIKALGLWKEKSKEIDEYLDELDKPKVYVIDADEIESGMSVEDLLLGVDQPE